MGSTSGGSSRDGSGGSNMPRGKGNVNFPTVRRSSRNVPNPCWGARSTTLGNVAPGSSSKKQKGVTEETPRVMSKGIKISASATPRYPNRASSAKNAAVRILSNKRKRMDTRSYIALFKPSSKAKATDAVVKSAKQSSIAKETKKAKENPFQKLQKLPDGCRLDFDNDHLCSVNNLREFWHKSQGAVFIDDKERVMKTVLFIMSVLPDVCRPFLVVTTASLSIWKAEFDSLAPIINVVVYDGDKNVRKSIRDLEFKENGSGIMSHVLLAHPDAFLEDIETVKGIRWEAVIVDYCQNSVLKLLKQLKQLTTDFRMVLLSSLLEDNLLEYKNLLAFLNSEEEDNGAHALGILRARFTRHFAYERKADSSNFLEYWVPAYLSQVQLQLYSSILLANSSVLQSQISTTSVKTLRDIILCLWKCCDHPCLVDEFPQNSLVNIDDRMHASGKLLLLETMLKEIRNKRSRVIVLFQTDGADENQMGKILEEFICDRFGPESYERVHNRSAFSKRQAATTMFNDMTKGRFVFLIESHACHSSIYLSSVDTIIIYGSDRNPLNDLKALGKIKIESQLEYLRIFRLYTPFTVEEKALVLAKQGMIVDGNIQDIMPSLSHCWLSWGVSFLFSRLDELSERGTVYMDKVISEFLRELSTNFEDSTKVNSATISKVYMSGEFYSRKIALIGEREGVSSLDGDPPSFWLNLLDGKSPCSRYLSETPQVKHRNLQNMEKPANGPAEETDEARRKRRKTGEMAGSSKVSSDVSNSDVFPDITPPSGDLRLLSDTRQELGVEILSTPKSLHVKIKCELSRLMKVLELPDNVRSVAEQLLEHFLKNHLVMQEPRGMLHAFHMALCWRAASLLKYKLDHRESLFLAAKCLSYEHNEELAGFFYKKIETLKEKVLPKAGETSNKVENDRFSSQESASTNLRNDHMFSEQAMDLHGNLTNGTPQESSSGAEQMVSDGQEVSAPEVDREHLSGEESPNMIVKKKIDLFNSVFSLREKNIHENQQLEILELGTQRDNQVTKLKEVCSLVLQHIRRSDIDEDTRNDQIKVTIQWFTMFVHAFLEHMRLQLDKLEALQSTIWFKERLMKEKLKRELTPGQLDQSFDLCIALPDSNFVIEEFIHFKKQNENYHVGETLASGCDQLINQESSAGESRSSEHAKRDNIANPSMLLGGATSLAVGMNTNNDDSVAADPAHLQAPMLASPQSLMTLSVSREVVTEANLSNMPAPQTVGTLQHPPAEVEPTDTLHVMEARDLQTDMQTSCSALDASPQSMCLDDPSQTSLEPDSLTGQLQERMTSYHLGDASMGVKDKSVDNVTTYADSCQTGHQLETTPDLSQGGDTCHHLVDAGMGVDANSNDTVCAHQGYSKSPTFAVPQSPAMLPFSSEVGTSANLSIMCSQQSSDAPLRHPPADAEPTGMLGTQAERDMQPSTSLLDTPLQRISPDDRNQTGCRPDRSTDLSEEHEIEYPTCATQNMAAWSREAEADNGQPSMPAQRGTSPHAHQSLATWQHPSEEAESAGILGMVPADDLQPSTSMLDQTAETERQGMMGFAAARNTQHVMQSSTTTQSVPLERTDVSGTPVPQNISLQQSLKPSRDTHAGVEQADVSGMAVAHDLQSETQSSSMHDQPAEAERAGTSGAMAAQGLLPEIQPSTSVQHIPPERAHPDERIRLGLEPNTTPGPEQLTQLFPVASAAFNHLTCSSEPLKNELERLKYCMDLLSKKHEQKKLLLQTEYNQEMEKLNKKYESLLQTEDSTYHRMSNELEDIYRKVFVHQSLAENFRREIFRLSAAQERSASPTTGQAPESSSHQVPARTSAAQSTASPTASPLTTRPPGFTSFHSTGSFPQPSPVARSPASEAIQVQSIFPGNLYRATSAPLSSVALGIGSYGAAGAQLHGPAPYLQHPRMPSPYAMVRRDQRQLAAAHPGITSLRQSARGVLEGSAGISAVSGVPLTPMAPGSVQQTMTPASNSHPTLPVSSRLPGSFAELMANFVTVTQQASSLNPGFHMSGPVNAAAGIWTAGNHIAGTNQPVPESSLMNAWSASRTGLTSGAAGTGVERGGSAEVVYLSDDE